MWLIDEYPSKGLIKFWFSPPIVLEIVFIIFMIKKIIIFLLITFIIIINGIIFWIVERIKQLDHRIIFIILINHIWKGNIPNLINKAIIIIIKIKLRLFKFLNKNWVKIENIKIIDLNDWIRKYLNLILLIILIFFFSMIKGINIIKFNSIKIHIINQLLIKILIKFNKIIDDRKI